MTPFGKLTRPAERDLCAGIPAFFAAMAAISESVELGVRYRDALLWVKWNAIHARPMLPYVTVDSAADDAEYEAQRDWRAENGRSNRWQDYQGGK